MTQTDAASISLDTVVVGESARVRTVPVNVRVLAGSKRDLKQMVADGTFREDLYYRLNVLPVVLPPLRERREDIPVLVRAFLERFFQRRGESPAPISDGVMQAFT